MALSAYQFAPFRWLAMWHVSLMRGSSHGLLFFIYFGLPFVGLQLDAITSTIVGKSFTAMSSAYISGYPLPLLAGSG